MILAATNTDFGTSHIGPGDRLGMTLFFAVVLHAILILGVTFSPTEKSDHKTLPTLEVTLVNTRSNEVPEEADYIAQANQEGSGTTEERVRVTSPFSAPPGAPSPGDANVVSMPRNAATQTPINQKEVLTIDEADHSTTVAQEKPLSETGRPSALQLMQRSMEIAQLNAEIDEKMQAYSKLKRHRYITARTKEARDAAYQESWRAKIERLGELNYPKDAKQRRLTGSLLLDVAINADGSVQEITLRRSSGEKTLDDAAIYIVRLAAPFAPLPPEILKDTDVLHITRTWQFLGDNSLKTR